MLQEAIDAVRQGQRVRARDLFTRLLRTDQSNVEYWLWMSAVVDSVKEQIYCLQSVLRLDPDNRTAKQGLVLLGAIAPDPDHPPVPLTRRNWEVPIEELPKPTGLKAIWANPVLRVLAFSGLAVIVIGLIVGGIFGFGSNRRRALVFRPTKTPGPPPTFTATPTLIPNTRVVVFTTPTPTFVGPTPLWMLLEATYTPTPLYVNTPHAISEAYRAGQRAFERGDYKAALNYMQQASEVDPQAADIPYAIGEINRLSGDFDAALAAYDESLDINANFAPAYLGRARVQKALNPGANIAKDLQTAIEKDPNFGEAYLDQIAYDLGNGEIQSAQENLDLVEQLLPDSPWLYYYRARVALLQGDFETALQFGQQALEMDRTTLPFYLLVGESALRSNQQIQPAIEALNTYLTYKPDQANAWMMLGEAYLQTGQNLTGAQEALDRALALDNKLGEAYQSRATARLELQDGQGAVNDFIAANRFIPHSFDVNLGLGRALLMAGRPSEARSQLTASLNLAESSAETAQVYFWRAQALEAIGNNPSAGLDWQELLSLPSDDVPAEWLAFANSHLNDIFTATPTPGTPTPGTPTPGKPTPKTPTPGTTALSTPTPRTSKPGTPAPGAPTPGTPTPGTPTPGTPTPATATPDSKK